jgi:FMN phosphatase YigB (HAD superfamily)
VPFKAKFLKVTMKFIFDLDGTLYNFDNTLGKSYCDSSIYKRVKENAFCFLQERLDFNDSQAKQELNLADKQCKGQLSVYLENKYGISKYEYFCNCYDLNPKEFITRNANIKNLFKELKDNAFILTGSPKIWARRTLDYLGVSDYIGDNILTGENKIVKPNPNAFLEATKILNCCPKETLSIGDQEHTDIIPAKAIGSRTAIIGKSNLADYQLENIDEMVSLVRSLNERHNI